MNSIEIEKQVISRLLQLPNLDKSRVARDNLNFKPPLRGLWCRVSIQGGINFAASISNAPCTREVGNVTIQIFDRENAATGTMKTFADLLARHFAYYQTDNLELLTPSLINVGIDGNGFYQMNLIIPYRYN